jgi:ATP-binding cassette subfamily B protein
VRSDLFGNFSMMLRSSWDADRRRSIGALATTAAVPVTRPLRSIGLAILTDGIIAGSVRRAVTGALVVALLTAANRLLDWASVTIRMRLREHTILFLDERVIELAAGAPGMEHHERPEHQDQMELLRADRNYLVNPFMPIAWTVAAVIQIGATVLVLAGLHPLLALLPLAGIPSLVFTMRTETWWERTRNATAEDTRQMVHLLELTTQPAAAKEVRIFGLAGELTGRYETLMRGVERRHTRLGVRTAALSSVGWAVFAAAYMAAAAFVVGRVLDGSLQVGAIVLTLSLGAQINSQLSELVSNTTWFSRTAHAVGRYRWLRDYVESSIAALAPGVDRVQAAPSRLEDGITLEGVSFAYPGTDRPVLAGVDLHLPAGSTVAIVGENGAGKTTLVKLLLRFYEPTAGRILVDGVDLSDIDIDDWRSHVSAGFQDFARFCLLAQDAVGVGWLPDIDSEPAVLAAFDRASAGDLVPALPAGLSTMLGREFEEGVDLSLGQWQKVAIARSLMRESPLLLALDEPTASLDAATEHELFVRFAGAAESAARARGAITLLVSHRFSTVRMADVIIVVADGRVAEHGSHAELVAADGLYAQLYELQARSYR